MLGRSRRLQGRSPARDLAAVRQPRCGPGARPGIPGPGWRARRAELHPNGGLVVALDPPSCGSGAARLGRAYLATQTQNEEYRWSGQAASAVSTAPDVVVVGRP